MREKYEVQFIATSPTSDYLITIFVMAENQSIAIVNSKKYLEKRTSHSPRNETNIRFLKLDKMNESENKNGFKFLKFQTSSI